MSHHKFASVSLICWDWPSLPLQGSIRKIVDAISRYSLPRPFFEYPDCEKRSQSFFILVQVVHDDMELSAVVELFR